MLGEAVLLTVVGALVGIVLAFAVRGVIGPTLEGFLGSFDFAATTVALAVGLALLIGLVIGLVPALLAKRLTIVDALRER